MTLGRLVPSLRLAFQVCRCCKRMATQWAAIDFSFCETAAAVSGWEAIVTMVPFGIGRPCPKLYA